MIKEQIRKELIDLLNKSGMSKTEFAEKMGVKLTTVSHWITETKWSHWMSIESYFKAKEILSWK